MRMFDLLTSGVIFAGRRGWGVVAMLGLAFGVILALGGSWARWVYLLFLLFPALEESEKRMTLEWEKLELLRMRATGTVDVPDMDGGEEIDEL